MSTIKESYYHKKSVNYGMGHTRLNRILKLTEGKGLRVLDVACASGYLGALIKQNGNYVEGIEMSAQAAEKAGKVLDRIHVFDIEDNWPSELADRNFDLVVLAEILEHVFDPVRVLWQVSKVLKPGGKVIITTPNFMTWTNRIRFLFGQFVYQEQGMFDFGHIRWFTYDYLKKVMAEAGLAIEREEHIIFPGKLTRLLKMWPSLFAFQFIIRARKI